jgi:hypothetical protein
MSDVSGKIKRGKGRKSRTFKVKGVVDRTDWPELFEKLKSLLKRSGVRLTRVQTMPKRRSKKRK